MLMKLLRPQVSRSSDDKYMLTFLIAHVMDLIEDNTLCDGLTNGNISHNYYENNQNIRWRIYGDGCVMLNLGAFQIVLRYILRF